MLKQTGNMACIRMQWSSQQKFTTRLNTDWRWQTEGVPVCVFTDIKTIYILYIIYTYYICIHIYYILYILFNVRKWYDNVSSHKPEVRNPNSTYSHVPSVWSRTAQRIYSYSSSTVSVQLVDYLWHRFILFIRLSIVFLPTQKLERLQHVVVIWTSCPLNSGAV